MHNVTLPAEPYFERKYQISHYPSVILPAEPYFEQKQQIFHYPSVIPNAVRDLRKGEECASKPPFDILFSGPRPGKYPFGLV